MLHPTRRDIIAGACALPLLPVAANANAAGLRVILLGQSLIQQDLRAQAWPGFARFHEMFRGADACFTDLETAIRGPHGGTVTRDPKLLHLADASVIDCLDDMGVTLYTTASNHAFDVGSGGIVDSIAALKTRNDPFAGTGLTLAEAAAPAYRTSRNGTVAVVAAATGKIREGGAATATRPGVNEIRRDASGALNEDDVGRMLAALREAASHADVVLAYDHNHYWEPDIATVPAWQRDFAHRCIAAGATCFVGHGAPLLQGIEIHRGKPIFYGLGNFIYQSPSPDNPYGDPTWKSVIADVQLSRAGLVHASLIPITLNAQGTGGAGDLVTRGRPDLASPADAGKILHDLDAANAPFDTRMQIHQGIGRIDGAA